MLNKIERLCRTSLGRLVIGMFVGRILAGIQNPDTCLAVTKTPAAGIRICWLLGTWWQRGDSPSDTDNYVR